MSQSHIIEMDGSFAGVAVRINRGCRFVAAVGRLDDWETVDWDTSVWPTPEDARRFTRRVLFSGDPAAP